MTVAVMGARDQFSFESGEPKYYRSSENVLRGFCNNCGTSLCWIGIWHDVEQMFVHAGTLDRIDLISPDRHAFFDARVPWFSIDDDFERFSESSPSGELI